MDLKNKLLKDIHDLSDKNERPYAGVTEDIESVKDVQSDVGSAILNVIKQILDGAESDSLDGLKHRIKRAEELNKNLEKAELGQEESGVLRSCISRVTFAIQKHIDEKRKVLSKASGAISKITPHLGDSLLGMTKNNPVVQLAVMAGGKISQLVKDKMQRSKEQKDIIKGDARSLYGSSLQTTSTAPEGFPPESDTPAPEGFDLPKAPFGGESGYLSESLVQESGPSYGNNSSVIASDVHFIAESLLIIIDQLKPIEHIASDVQKLVQASQTQADLQDQLALDRAEGSMEGGGLFPGASSQAGAQTSKAGGGLLGKMGSMMPDMKGIGGVAKGAMGSLSKVLFSGTTALVAGLVWATVDGITGWLKSEDWGVSKISGFIGGFFGGTGDNQVKRTIANMGKWALMGAGIGSFIPVIGTAIGGLIGALIGGLMGWIGGENIAGFFDEFGYWISDNFNNGFDMMKNFFSDMWGNARSMIDKVLNIVDSIKLSVIEWVKKIADWIPGANSVVDSLDQEKKQIESRMQERNDSIQQREENSQKRRANLSTQRQKQQSAKEARQERRQTKQAERGVVQSAGGTNVGGQTSPVTPMIDSGGITPGGTNLSKDETKSAVLAELQAKGITDPDAQANILANLQAESGFKAQSENLNYSAKTLMKLYGPGSGNKVRVRSLEEAQAIVDKGPEAVGNLIYGGRMGNAGDEGYKYRGRGLVQLTGKDNYTAMSKKLGVDLISNPDLANDPQIAAKISAQYYADRKSKFDYTNINQVAKATGHAGGAQENLRRAQYAQQLKGEMASGKISASGVLRPEQIQPSAPVVTASLNPDMSGAAVIPANYDMVNKKSASSAQPQATVINNTNNATSVSGGGQTPASRPNDVGTSSMRPTAQRAWQT